LPASSLFETRGIAKLAEASRVFGEIILSPAEPPWSRQKVQEFDQAALEKRSKFLLWASAALADGFLVQMGF
jgi:hypothetical protein